MKEISSYNYEELHTLIRFLDCNKNLRKDLSSLLENYKELEERYRTLLAEKELKENLKIRFRQLLIEIEIDEKVRENLVGEDILFSGIVRNFHGFPFVHMIHINGFNEKNILDYNFIVPNPTFFRIEIEKIYSNVEYTQFYIVTKNSFNQIPEFTLYHGSLFKKI